MMLPYFPTWEFLKESERKRVGEADAERDLISQHDDLTVY